jgi:signal transduction histidine kinase
MRSIRLSLMLYFLGLLAAGLLVVAVLADRISARALREKELAAIAALELRLTDRIQDERDKFDRDLLVHVRDLRADYLAISRQGSMRLNFAVHAPAFAAISTSPIWGATTWLAATTPPMSRRSPGPLFLPYVEQYIQSRQLSTLPFLQLDGDEPEYIEIHSPSGEVRSSPNLSGHRLDLNRREIESLGDEWVYTCRNLQLPSGQPARGIVYRTPLFDRGRRSPSLTSTRPPVGEPRGPQFPFSFIYLARPSEPLDARIAEIHEYADRERRSLSDVTQRIQTWIRFVLAITAVLTFLSVVAGGQLLIRRSLAPLRNLTTAVSQVSQRDFRLPILGDELPHELLPIHDRLTKTLDELKLAFEREKQAVADISHELRTPVAALLATIDVSLRKPREAEKYRETLQECRVITKQLGQLVERVMTLAYLDAGQTKLATAPSDVGELVRNSVALIRPLAESHAISVSSVGPDSLILSTDADRVREVLVNLLHNAIEYNRPGGTIHVTLQDVAKHVELSVRDTGIGMTDDVKSRIFERFYRADASRTATGIHAGLGLAIVKEYLDRMGANITCTSERNVGTEFVVTLPK